MSLAKVDHLNTIETPLKCVLCPTMTTYRAVWRPVGLFELRKPVCPDCIQDFLRAGRFVGNLLGSIETNTRSKIEPGDDK